MEVYMARPVAEKMAIAVVMMIIIALLVNLGVFWEWLSARAPITWWSYSWWWSLVPERHFLGQMKMKMKALTNWKAVILNYWIDFGENARTAPAQNYALVFWDPENWISYIEIKLDN